MHAISAEPIQYMGHYIQVTVSIGYSPVLLPPDDVSLGWERVLGLVDKALYMAKLTAAIARTAWARCCAPATTRWPPSTPTSKRRGATASSTCACCVGADHVDAATPPAYAALTPRRGRRAFARASISLCCACDARRGRCRSPR